MKNFDHPVEALRRGYTEGPEGRYTCLACGAGFEAGEVYTIGGRAFLAPRAVEEHLAADHPDYTKQLINSDSKHNGLTQNQRRLMELFAAGVPDKEIAAELSVSVSTVRHQKFMFKEKARGAAHYLACYLRAMEGRKGADSPMMPIPEGVIGVDERFIVTQEEREQILKTAFTSLEPLRLKTFPRKEKKKVVVLTQVAGLFGAGQKYSEKEVNTLLEGVWHDYATLRRYLIEYGFMDRTSNGAEYWMR